MTWTFELLASKLASAAGRLRFLPPALRLVWDAAARWPVAWAALLIAQGLLPIAILYLTWIDDFRRFASGRTVLLITHRFSTAACADVVYRMSAGRIAECTV